MKQTHRYLLLASIVATPAIDVFCGQQPMAPDGAPPMEQPGERPAGPPPEAVPFDQDFSFEEDRGDFAEQSESQPGIPDGDAMLKGALGTIKGRETESLGMQDANAAATGGDKKKEVLNDDAAQPAEAVQSTLAGEDSSSAVKGSGRMSSVENTAQKDVLATNEESESGESSNEHDVAPVDASTQETVGTGSIDAQQDTEDRETVMPESKELGVAQELSSEASAAEKEKIAEPKVSHEYLDSVEDGPGNWFFKAKIMKQARLELNEIRKLSDKVQALREPNQKMAETLDTRFDAFYNECGFQKGEIVVTLKYMEEQLDSIKGEHGGDAKKIAAQSPAIAETIKDLEEKRDMLKQMDENFSEIKEDDKLARELFDLLGNEIGRAHQYLDVALEKYEEIENTLNDETAEFNLHAIEAAKTNIENIERYLTGEFANFYSRLSSRVDTLMSSVRTDLQKLRDVGVELNRKIREERERQEKERIAAEKLKKQEELQKIEDAKLVNRIKRFGSQIWQWSQEQISRVMQFFARDKKAEAPKSS